MKTADLHKPAFALLAAGWILLPLLTHAADDPLKEGFTRPPHEATPLGNGKMLYGMCDGSVQILPDFWPFQDPEWPEPWKAFHPLGKSAPASEAP